MDTKYGVFLVYYLCSFLNISADEKDEIEVIDMTRPTHWKALAEYYSALEKRWKMCLNCGSPGVGTAMHMEHTGSANSMHPAVIPSEYLVTRLAMLDVSTIAASDDEYVLSLDVALQWPVLRHDPRQPTLLLFKFGWKDDSSGHKMRSCVCKIPGIAYDLAEYIALNLTHVVGVGTDAPTLESRQTRESTTNTVSNLLGKSGIYMIENVLIRKKIPDQGCMAISMPIKLQTTSYVPARLSAFCPKSKTDKQVTIALRKTALRNITNSRIYDVNLAEILSNK